MGGMARRAAGIALLALLSAPPAWSGQGALLQFFTDVPDVYVGNVPPKVPRQTTLGGELIDPPMPLASVVKNQATWSTPVEAAQSDASAWKANDPDWIKRNFVMQEQASVDAFLKRYGDRNLELQASLRTTELWATARYKEYALVFLSNNAERKRGKVLVFREENGYWKRTNALSADPVFHLVTSAFMQGRITQNQ